MNRWDVFYQDFSSPGPSTFASWVDTSITGLEHVLALVDIGCGNGRDTFFFAEKGFRVLAVDSSTVAISSITRRNIPYVEGVCADAISEAALRSVVKQWRCQYSVLYYSRFFLHTVAQDEQMELLRNITKWSREGDWIALEYRTLDDGSRYKTFDDHDRYYVDHARVADHLMMMKWDIVHSAEGTGMAPFGSEDPAIGRILARR